MSSKIEEAKAALAKAEKEARKLDTKIAALKSKRRGIARSIEAATKEIIALTPPNPIPPTKIGG